MDVHARRLVQEGRTLRYVCCSLIFLVRRTVRLSVFTAPKCCWDHSNDFVLRREFLDRLGHSWANQFLRGLQLRMFWPDWLFFASRFRSQMMSTRSVGLPRPFWMPETMLISGANQDQFKRAKARGWRCCPTTKQHPGKKNSNRFAAAGPHRRMSAACECLCRHWSCPSALLEHHDCAFRRAFVRA